MIPIYRVLWAKPAQNDLKNIILYIKKDSVSMAKAIFDEIRFECDQLNYFPARKRVVPELLEIGVENYRELIHKRWRVVFRIDNELVYIVAVIDSSRDLESVLKQRLTKQLA